MKKKYVKPVSLLIQTGDLCAQTFIVGSVIKGTDKKTPDSYITLVEDKDTNGNSNTSSSAWDDTGLWGGD